MHRTIKAILSGGGVRGERRVLEQFIRCVLCFAPLADGDELHTCRTCTAYWLTQKDYTSKMHRTIKAILSGGGVRGERRVLEQFIRTNEGSARGIVSLDDLKIRRLALFALAKRDIDLWNRLAAWRKGRRKTPRIGERAKSRTTATGRVRARDVERAKPGRGRGANSCDLALVADASAQQPEEDAHLAESFHGGAESVADSALANVVAARGAGGPQSDYVDRQSRASRGASMFAARMINARGRKRLSSEVAPQRVLQVADALFSMRPGGWLREDEASRTQDEIEAKAKRDARAAELKENPGLSKNKRDGARDFEEEKKKKASKALKTRKRMKAKREGRS